MLDQYRRSDEGAVGAGVDRVGFAPKEPPRIGVKLILVILVISRPCRPKNFGSIDWLIWMSGWQPKAVARLVVADLAAPMMMKLGS